MNKIIEDKNYQQTISKVRSDGKTPDSDMDTWYSLTSDAEKRRFIKSAKDPSGKNFYDQLGVLGDSFVDSVVTYGWESKNNFLQFLIEYYRRNNGTYPPIHQKATAQYLAKVLNEQDISNTDDWLYDPRAYDGETGGIYKLKTLAFLSRDDAARYGDEPTMMRDAILAMKKDKQIMDAMDGWQVRDGSYEYADNKVTVKDTDSKGKGATTVKPESIKNALAKNNIQDADLQKLFTNVINKTQRDLRNIKVEPKLVPLVKLLAKYQPKIATSFPKLEIQAALLNGLAISFVRDGVIGEEQDIDSVDISTETK